MNDDELHSVAIHEAGHVVVASLLDLLVQGTEVFVGEKGRWFGKSHTYLSKQALVGVQALIPPEFLFKNGAIVAVAGFLAQAKYSATISRGTDCQFQYLAELGPLIYFFRDTSLVDDAPGVALVPFLIRSTVEERKHELSGLNFSGMDRKFFLKNLKAATGAIPELIVQEAMQLLDNPKNWQQVNELAKTLIEQEPTGENQRRVLNSEQISLVFSKDSVQ